MIISTSKKRSNITESYRVSVKRSVSETGAGILQTLGAVPAYPRKVEPPIATIKRPTVPKGKDLRLIRQISKEELDYQNIINNPRSGLHAWAPQPEPKPHEEPQPEKPALHGSRIELPVLSAKEIAATSRELKDLPAPKNGEKSLLSEAHKKLVVDFYRVHKHPYEVARLTGVPVEQVIPIMAEYRASVVARFDQLKASGLTWKEIEGRLGHGIGSLIRWGRQAHGKEANPKS